MQASSTLLGPTGSLPVAPSAPPKQVQHLTTGQLIAVLKKRGIAHQPTDPRDRLLELCRANNIVLVPASELGPLTPLAPLAPLRTPAATTGAAATAVPALATAVPALTTPAAASGDAKLAALTASVGPDGKIVYAKPAAAAAAAPDRSSPANDFLDAVVAPNASSSISPIGSRSCSHHQGLYEGGQSCSHHQGFLDPPGAKPLGGSGGYQPSAAALAFAPAAGVPLAAVPAAAQIVLSVQQLVLGPALTTKTDLSVYVQIEALQMSDVPLETPNVIMKSGTAAFEYSRTIDLAPGNRAWNAVALALSTKEEEDSDVYFTVRDAATKASICEAFVNLESLLAAGKDEVSSQRPLKDAADSVVGRLTVTVAALDALRKVKAAAPPALTAVLPKPVASPAAAPPKRLAELSVAELQALLKRRGVTMPPDEQPKSYYYEAAVGAGIGGAAREVSAAELAEATAAALPPPAATAVVEAAPPVVQVDVPPGVSAGSPIEVEYNGARFTVAVPAGAVTGQTITVNVPPSAVAAAATPPPASVAEPKKRGHRIAAPAAAEPKPAAATASAGSTTGGAAAKATVAKATASAGSAASGKSTPPISEAERRRNEKKLYSDKLRAEQQQQKEKKEARRRSMSGAEDQKKQAAAIIQARYRQTRTPSPQTSPPRLDKYKPMHAGGAPAPSPLVAEALADRYMKAREETSTKSPPPRAATPRQSVASAAAAAGEAVPLGAAPAAAEVEHALVVAFEKLGDTKAKLAAAVKEKEKAVEEAAALKREAAALKAELKAEKAAKADANQKLADSYKARQEVQAQLDRARGGGGAPAPPTKAGTKPVTAAEARRAAGAQQRGYAEGQRKRYEKLQAAKESEAKAMYKRLSDAQDATEAETRRRQEAERALAECEQKLYEVLAELNAERGRGAAWVEERVEMQQLVRELQLDAQETATMLEAESEMRKALQEGLAPPLQPGGSRPPTTSVSSAAPPIPRAASPAPSRGGASSKGGGVSPDGRRPSGSGSAAPTPSRTKGVNRLLEDGPAPRPTSPLRAGTSSAPGSPRKGSRTLSAADVKVSKYEHRWASQQERNLAVLMQGMAESLAASISHQDQKDRITRRAHGGRYKGWA